MRIIQCLFFLFSVAAYAQDSLLVIENGKGRVSDTLELKSIEGVVYRNEFFIQGEVIEKTGDSLRLDAVFINAQGVEQDSLMMVAYTDISAVLFHEPVKNYKIKNIFSNNRGTKILRGVLLAAGAASIIFTNYEEATILNYIPALVLIPITLMYHALIEFSALETKKIKLVKGVSKIS